MTYFNFDEDLFRQDVDKALEHVNRILQVHRNPCTPDTVDHEYSDKYHLANLMTNINIIAHVNCLQKMGLTADILKNLDKTKATTLRFQAFETCEFLKQVDVEIPMERTVETVEDTQTTSSSFFGSTTKATITRVVNRIKEYHWKVGIEWEISVYSGTNIHEKIVLQSKKSSTIVIIQSTKEAPIPKSREHPPMEASLTWLLEQIDVNSMVAKFKIDMTNPTKTKTPLRNEQIECSADFLMNFSEWIDHVNEYFCRSVQHDILKKHHPAKQEPALTETNVSDLESILKDINVFNPVVPLMEENQTADKINGEDGTPTTINTTNQQSILALSNTLDVADSATFSPVLSRTDITKIINEHLRSLEEKIQSLKKIFPHEQLSEYPISIAEATIVLLCMHMTELYEVYMNSISYIEWMLEQQLIAAIGKRVNSTDMDKFVRFHNSKLLSVAPKPFCHSVRRPNHYPEGVLTIESDTGSNHSSNDRYLPIDTFVREVQMSSPLQVPLNAAATLELTGKTFFHGWLVHRFKDTIKHHNLIARARQFSSFMLVVGTMTGPNQFDPKDAIILQNKDEVIIPLLLEELPSAKEFKDAIQSLSPEQQRFAKSFRSMQLGSSVLGICIIQIKPQLEVLLNLPADSLTKEMKLTQDLMELFIEYQIPSDLLSYDGEGGETSVREKVEIVKSHVEAVMGVIGSAKNKQLEESTKKAGMAVYKGMEGFGGGGGGASPFLFPTTTAAGVPSSPPIELQVERVKAQMQSNIANMLKNTERAESLSDKSDALNEQASVFKKRSAALKKQSKWNRLGVAVGTASAGPARRRPAKKSAAAPLNRGAAVSQATITMDQRTSAPQAELRLPEVPPPPNTTLAVSVSAATSTAAATTTATSTATVGTHWEANNEKTNQGVQAISNHHDSTNDDHVAEDDLSEEKQQEQLSSSPSDLDIDFTNVPKLLDTLIEEHDKDGSLRSTTIKIATDSGWTRKRQQDLLSKVVSENLTSDDGIKTERNKAFDLLDALSRSGSLPIAFSELHVIICMTHRFDKTVMETVIQENINPIEKLELSTLLFASVINHGGNGSGETPLNMRRLLRETEDAHRLAASFPNLFQKN